MREYAYNMVEQNIKKKKYFLYNFYRNRNIRGDIINILKN